jgi:hypothetical protein
MLQMQIRLAQEYVNKHSPFQGLAQSLSLKMADIAMLHLKTPVH